MSSNTGRPHVLIIGGGLGGPTLAQALRKQGITFDIFERDSSDMARTQGWAVLLNDQCIKDFTELLPNDLPSVDTVDQLYEHGIPTEAAFYDLSNGEAKQKFRIGAKHGERMIRANRARLRRWLTTNVHVHWNKRLERYTEDDEGVTAYFEDGTSYRGDLLVGADGVNSRVKDQLLVDQSLRPQYIPTGIVIGELTATKEQYQRWLKFGTSLIVGMASDDRRVVIAMKGIAADKQTAEYYWLFGWHDENATKKDFWTTSASQEELQRYVVNRLDGLNLDFTEALRATPAKGMLYPPLRISDMVPPELPRGRVTLLGDAVHPMTPFRGQGANTAIADGLSLSKVLAAHGTAHVSDTLKIYEDEMRPRATEAVLSSRHGWRN